MILTIEKIQNEILEGRLNSSEFIFTSDSMLLNAIEIINQYNTEPNPFIKESLKTGVDSAKNYINEYKANEIKRVDEIVKKKEEKRQEQEKKRQEAISLLPKLSKHYNEVESLINQIAILDDGVLKSPYMSIYSNYKKSFEEIHNEFKSCIAETISKGVK